MIDLIFTIAMLIVFGKLLILALKCAWSITKIICTIILLPLLLVLLVFAGMFYVAAILLVIVGVLAFLGAVI